MGRTLTPGGVGLHTPARGIGALHPGGDKSLVRQAASARSKMPEGNGSGKPWPTDEELAARVARGDTGAFGALYERYQRPIYRYCLRIVANPEDARDVLQTTMLNAFRALRGRPRELQVRPWLYRIAHNEAVSHVRHARGHEPLRQDVPSLVASADALVERDRLIRALGDLSALPPRGRNALALRAFLALDYREIGQRLAITEGAARQAVFEARDALEESERGRSLDCGDVSDRIASGDGRRLRGRALSVHLAACERCSTLADSVRRSGRRVAALPSILLPIRLVFPHLPGRADGLASLAGAIGGGVGMKGVAAIVAVGIGTGAVIARDADRGQGTLPHRGVASATAPFEPAGAPSTPSSGSRDGAEPTSETAGATVKPDPSDPSAGTAVGSESAPPEGLEGDTAVGAAGTAGEGQPGGTASAPQHHAEGGSASGPGTRGGSPDESSGTSAPADGETPSSAPSPPADGPGNSESAPGHGGTPPGQGGTPPGHSQGTPANGVAVPPGQGGALPGQTGAGPGNSENAPGHAGDQPGQEGGGPAGQDHGQGQGPHGGAPPGQLPGDHGIGNGNEGGGAANGGGGGDKGKTAA